MDFKDTEQAPYIIPQTATVSDEAVHAAEAQFTSYFINNYPKDCIIYNPAWHAPKIFRAAKAAMTENIPHLALTAAPCSVEVKKLEWTEDGQRKLISKTEIYDYLIYKSPVDGEQIYTLLINGSRAAEYTEWFLSDQFTCQNVAIDAAASFHNDRILSQIVTKPVDVATVHIQALEEFAKAITGNDNFGFYDGISADWHPYPEHQIRKNIKDTIRALSPAEPVDQWRDIATAPKDGTWIIAIRPERSFGQWDRVVIVCWSDDYKKWIWPDDVFDVYKDDINETDDEGLCKHYPYQSLDFTHWMALPAAPTSKGGE